MMGGGARHYQVQLRCFSAPFSHAEGAKLESVNFGGKILLPNSALDMLTRMHIEYPMLFKIMSLDARSQRVTHAGVLEFSAEEGRCYVAAWMMKQLHLEEGDLVNIEYVKLPRATFAKFKPKAKEFLDISNPRAVLEVELRKFACLTKGDVIAVKYNSQIIEFGIQKVEPGNAVSIIECDVNIEFEAIDGLEEESRESTPSSSTAPGATMSAGKLVTVQGGGSSDPWAAFGQGMRVDGKAGRLSGGKQATPPSTSATAAGNQQRPNQGRSPLDELVVNIDYRPGHLTFPRDYTNLATLKKEAEEEREKK